MKNTYISVPLNQEGIVQFYDNCARRLNGETAENYDCTKIEVSRERFNYIQSYYSDYDNVTFGMTWCCYGPKVNEELHDSVVLIQDGFIPERKEV